MNDRLFPARTNYVEKLDQVSGSTDRPQIFSDE